MENLSRRRFLQSSATAAVVSAAPFMIASQTQAAPSERIRHAIIGTGGQGRHHCERFVGFKTDCEIAAICDVDPAQRAKAMERIGDKANLKQVDDYRKILDDSSIDSVSVTTPDHWHSKIAIEAVLAGKHVYVEKPCSHNIREGILLQRAAAKYGKCVQQGTQSRSGEGIQRAIEFMREGKLGKIRLAKAINHQLRKPIGRAEVTGPPEGVNYDLWTGPAPVHPFTQNRWHYNWHWFWDYGCGDIGNDGIHQIDAARWGLGVGMPIAVSASGGQLFYDDDHETPDTQMVTYEYDDCFLVYEMRLWTDYKLEGHDNGNVFYGDKGKLEVGRKGCFVTLIDEEPQKIGGGSDIVAHMRNFLDCVKSNDPSKLNAPVSEGAVSAALCHLGNIGTRVDRKLHLDLERMEIKNDAEANALFGRTYRAGYELPNIG